ncbi:MAG: hypothetical protein ABSD49_10370 [Candidatus Bathyarchaeia archaeon]|jgi:predicted transcriptional regulator
MLWSVEESGQNDAKESKTHVEGQVRDRKNRSRTRILLTRTELAQLHSAVIETRANKSFLVVEAIQRGLRESDYGNIPTKRACKIDAWIPRDFKQRIKQLAEAYSVTQQSILRHFLFRYLKATPWKQTSETIPTQEVPHDQT